MATYIDVMKTEIGQIWYYGDNKDKFHLDDDDYVIGGKRPVLIIQTNGFKLTVIPFSKSTRYSMVNGSCQFPNVDFLSYVAFDNVTTINERDLSEYVGVCKETAFNRIRDIFVEYYVNRNIVYSAIHKAYVYRTKQNMGPGTFIKRSNTIRNISNGLLQEKPITISVDNHAETDSDIAVKEVAATIETKVDKQKKTTTPKVEHMKYKQYTDEEKLFILTHTTEESKQKFAGVDPKRLYYIRSTYKVEKNSDGEDKVVKIVK